MNFFSQNIYTDLSFLTKKAFVTSVFQQTSHKKNFNLYISVLFNHLHLCQLQIRFPYGH